MSNKIKFLTSSCSICKKKQNLHFIIPEASFKLLQVTLLPIICTNWYVQYSIKPPQFVKVAPCGFT